MQRIHHKVNATRQPACALETPQRALARRMDKSDAAHGDLHNRMYTHAANTRTRKDIQGSESGTSLAPQASKVPPASEGAVVGPSLAVASPAEAVRCLAVLGLSLAAGPAEAVRCLAAPGP